MKCEIVIDNKKIFKKSKCKNCGEFYINLKNICINHAKLLYNKYAIYIQKIYRRYKCNKYLNNIYKKLPEDLQNIIKYNINKKLYIDKENRNISKIIYKKSDDIIYNYILNKKKIDINTIIYIFNIYTKYFNILDINYIKYFNRLANEINYFYSSYYIYSTISDIYYIPWNFFENEIILSNIIDAETFTSLIKSIKNFKNKTCQNYSINNLLI